MYVFLQDRARTSEGNNKDNVDDQVGGMPSWMFEENSKKKPAQPKEKDIPARRDMKVKGGATEEECVARPVVTEVRLKKSDEIHPLKVTGAMSSVDKSTIDDLQKKDWNLKKCFDRVGRTIIRKN